MTLTVIRVFLHKMTSSSSSLLVPVGVRGMTVLDRSKFNRAVLVPVLRVAEDSLAKITKCVKPYYLKLENFRPVQSIDEEPSKKCVFLHPEKITKWEDIPDTTREHFQECEVNEQNFGMKEINLEYQNFSFHTIFKAVLPEDEDTVAGFSQTGHIIHLNLRDHLLEYRHLIGQVLIDKIKTCRTVIIKSNIIANTYRNFSLELIAGEEDYVVTIKENRCNFQFDFSKVYWNSRLGKEHERILGFLSPSDVLFDVFCGVGPFAVPAAKRKCRVFANDLNPDSFKWLNHNAEINKVNKSLLTTFNYDGKDFILNVFKEFLIDLCKSDESNYGKIHVTMNLPAMAVEFLKYFKGLIKHVELVDKFNKEIIVYVYCFTASENSIPAAKQMVNDHMACDMSPYILDVFFVRNVAPKKDMMRVTFKLAKEILFNLNNSGEPPSKKLCIES